MSLHLDTDSVQYELATHIFFCGVPDINSEVLLGQRARFLVHERLIGRLIGQNPLKPRNT